MGGGSHGAPPSPAPPRHPPPPWPPPPPPRRPQPPPRHPHRSWRSPRPPAPPPPPSLWSGGAAPRMQAAGGSRPCCSHRARGPPPARRRPPPSSAACRWAYTRTGRYGRRASPNRWRLSWRRRSRPSTRRRETSRWGTRGRRAVPCAAGWVGPAIGTCAHEGVERREGSEERGLRGEGWMGRLLRGFLPPWVPSINFQLGGLLGCPPAACPPACLPSCCLPACSGAWRPNLEWP
eukprot:1136216-Prymnesium_polylepis.1